MRKIRNGQHIEVERFLEDLKNVVNEGQQLLKSGFTGVKQQTLGGLETITEFAHENPVKAIGIGFALGLLAGLGTVLLFWRSED
jgi:ElaB/YqjD/DUF883 family membrane-anchored ribosome-binding protein